MPNILIVDDESYVTDCLMDVLQFAGWQAVCAGNGTEAIMKILDKTWDVVLLDISMPELNGINALRIIRRLAPSLPVIMLTEQVEYSDMYEAMRLGAFACLMKPVAINKLLETSRQALTHSEIIAVGDVIDA